MPLEVSRYEGAATAFLVEFPVGSPVGAEEIVGFASRHANGLAPDLLVTDPGKRLNTIRRHLNHGGGSRNLAEESRFFIEVIDAKRGLYHVRKLSEVALDMANDALAQAVKGSMGPSKRSLRALEAIKVEELDAEDANKVDEGLRRAVEEMAEIATVMRGQITRRMIHDLAQKGLPEEVSRRLIEIIPEMVNYNRLLKITG